MAQAQGNRRERRRNKKLAGKAAPTKTFAGGPKANADTVTNLLSQAETLVRDGNFSAALPICRQLISTHPERADVQYATAVVLDGFGQYDSAYLNYKQAVTIDPGVQKYWLRFSLCLRHMEQNDAARMAAEQGLLIDPENIEALLVLSLARRQVEDAEGALEVCDLALKIDPKRAEAHFGRARSLASLGRNEDAEAAYLDAIRHNRFHFTAYANLLDMKSERLDLNAARQAANDFIAIKNPASSEFVNALHVLGAVEDRSGDPDTAFQHIARANALRFKDKPFNGDGFESHIDLLIRSFTPELFERHAASGDPSEKPVFVVGMPRSGSTLIDQIIVSHSKAHGVGEHSAMWKLADALANAGREVDQDSSGSQMTISRDGGLKRYPADVGNLDTGVFAPLAASYLDTVSKDAPDTAARIVDKTLKNFLHLGLIALMFPNAKIIYSARDPMASGLSCFFENFIFNLPYTTDLASLGVYHRNMERLMAHWQDVLPVPILKVQYEEMVGNQDAESRRLIEFLGLDWEDACLDFQNAERSVSTASIWQVRQPIYKSSVARWKRYEKHLDPLKKALAGEA